MLRGARALLASRSAQLGAATARLSAGLKRLVNAEADRAALNGVTKQHTKDWVFT
tara:strand:- start:2601 stop:2765 length:165 start_codon:yes stop_codon:yes gene_type:complete